MRGFRSAGLASLGALVLALAAALLALSLPTAAAPALPDIVRAQDLFAAGRFRDAERLLVGRPSPEARWLLARCYAEGGLLEDARDTLEGLTDRPEAVRLLVKVCLDSGDFARAAPHVRRLAKDDPDNADLLKLLAQCESRSGNPVAALAAANRALALDPSDVEAGRLVGELASSLAVSPPRSSSALRRPSSRDPSSVFRHPSSTPKELLHGSRPR